MSNEIDRMAKRSGRVLKEDGSYINQADMIEAMYKALIVDKNVGIRLSESIPTGDNVIGKVGIDPTDNNVKLSGSKAYDFVPVTPNDDEDLPGGVTAGLFIGTAGTITVVMANGQGRVVLPETLAIGVIHPISVKRIKDAGTGAGGIHAVY